jgi:hypothetical protein
VSILAKKGYAVAGINAKTTLGVDGMSVIFMALTPEGLDPSRTYTSEWIGGSPNVPKVRKLAGDGSLVVGIFGEASRNSPSGLVGLGLVTIPKE